MSLEGRLATLNKAGLNRGKARCIERRVACLDVITLQLPDVSRLACVSMLARGGSGDGGGLASRTNSGDGYTMPLIMDQGPSYASWAVPDALGGMGGSVTAPGGYPGSMGGGYGSMGGGYSSMNPSGGGGMGDMSGSLPGGLTANSVTLSHMAGFGGGGGGPSRMSPGGNVQGTYHPGQMAAAGALGSDPSARWMGMARTGNPLRKWGRSAERSLYDACRPIAKVRTLLLVLLGTVGTVLSGICVAKHYPKPCPFGNALRITCALWVRRPPLTPDPALTLRRRAGQLGVGPAAHQRGGDAHQ